MEVAEAMSGTQNDLGIKQKMERKGESHRRSLYQVAVEQIQEK